MKNKHIYIALIRAVMPFGKNKVPMSKLRIILLQAGFENVRTYIQSGNLIVESKLSAGEVEESIHELIKRTHGPDLVVVVRTKEELQLVLENNPFTQGFDQSRVFFVFFASQPPEEKVLELQKQDFSSEKLYISGKMATMYIPGAYGRQKLSSNYLEKMLGVDATMRSYNTVSKLIELSGKT